MSERVLHLHRLIIGDDEGQHLRLDAAGVSMFDDTRTKRAQILMTDGGALCRLFDAKGSARVEVRVANDGNVTVAVDKKSHRQPARRMTRRDK